MVSVCVVLSCLPVKMLSNFHHILKNNTLQLLLHCIRFPGLCMKTGPPTVVLDHAQNILHTEIRVSLLVRNRFPPVLLTIGNTGMFL